jgi:hypothetical protein
MFSKPMSELGLLDVPICPREVPCIVSVAKAILATKVWIVLTGSISHSAVIRGKDMLMFTLAAGVCLLRLEVGPNVRLNRWRDKMGNLYGVLRRLRMWL